MQSRKVSMILVVTLGACLAGLARTASAADNERTLYVFSGAADGGSPYSDLTFDAQGNLYGTTRTGGAFGAGTVFKLTPGANGMWSETVLHSFRQDGKDGFTPEAGVIFDKLGNLWGTTSNGGANGGVVFELTPGPNGTWSETALPFPPGAGLSFPYGAQPESDLIFDKAGNIYGTALSGGAHGVGAVFKVAQTSNGSWSITTLYSFSSDGGNGPHAALTSDADGNLYGTTVVGGGPAGAGNGAVFKLTRGSNGAWVETVLHIFVKDSMGNSPGGFGPSAGLVFDAADNLYGVTYSGGASAASAGVVFRLARGSDGTWSETALYSFNPGEKDGSGPLGRLILDAAGNLYGTTQSGGMGYGGGTIFKLAPGASGAWTETVLHGFDFSGSEGLAPNAGLILDAAGNLYGTNSAGSGINAGTVFEILAGSDPAVSSNSQSAPSPGASGAGSTVPPYALASQATDGLASVWQSDAYAGETFHFKFDGSAIYVYGSQQELIGTLQQKGKNGVIDMYEGLVQIPPLTQCPAGRGLMQIKTWNDDQLDAKIETPMSTSSGVTCGGLLGTGRMVRWQQVTSARK